MFSLFTKPEILCLIFKALHMQTHGVNLGNPKRRTKLHLEKVQDVCVWEYPRCPRWSSRVQNCIREQEAGVSL